MCQKIMLVANDNDYTMVNEVWSRDPECPEKFPGDLQEPNYFHDNTKKLFVFFGLVFSILIEDREVAAYLARHLIIFSKM